MTRIALYVPLSKLHYATCPPTTANGAFLFHNTSLNPWENALKIPKNTPKIP
jgi:hypothetical protein